MKKVLFGAVVVLVVLAAGATLFGDNLRKTFGASAQSLTGDSLPSLEMQAKSMQQFGASPAYAPPPPPPPTLVESKAMFVESEAVPSGGDRFAHHAPNGFVHTLEDRLSTFAVDVDTASWTLSRRYLAGGHLPNPSGVRVEEWVNAFRYQYEPPKDGAFTVHFEAAPSPYSDGRHLLRVGLQGEVVSPAERKPLNLVFLVDTSGSMGSNDKLPLAKHALRVLLANLDERDTVALVTYAGGVRDVLPPTPATERGRIVEAIDALSAGGGTAMGSGMEIAYRHAVRKVSPDAVSRVIVLSDGDANIGATGPDEMLKSVKGAVEEGVTLSTIGFGMGNYRDDLMERLANAGNGNSFYVDSPAQAQRLFEEDLVGTMQVIAKDVKIQVAFDPIAVRQYRLVGYENRDVRDEDFRDDRVDAGEIGAGHSVTAIYEVELTGEGDRLATVSIRAKAPNGHEAKERSFAFTRDELRPTLEEASRDFRFQVAVAGAADILRQAPAAEGWSLERAIAVAEDAVDGDPDRFEFVQMMERARTLLAEGRTVSHVHTEGY